jgi:GGDEF domain-containing protein
MDQKRFDAWGSEFPAACGPKEVPFAEQCVSLLLEAAALNMPEFDAVAYREFRTNITRLALQISDPTSQEDKLSLLRTIAHEFENYYATSVKVLRERQSSWRSLTVRMARELLTQMGVNPTQPNAALLLKQASELSTEEALQEFRALLESLIRPAAGGNVTALRLSADRSSSNDNAVGLPGSGAAVERVDKIIAEGGRGFIVLFRLSCLDVVRQRFGPEAVQDSLQAVSVFLTNGLHSDDSIYHWNETALLAVLQGRASEQILAAELQRLVMSNRETNIHVGGRNVMVRIPITFDLASIEKLHSAEDLFQLGWLRIKE